MIAEAILRGADAYDARKKFDPEIRASYLNASEAMTCIRKQWFAKNGAEMDGPEDWGYARRGAHGEAYIVERLRLANVPMMFTGDDQLSLQDDERRISCTPDGLVQIEGDWYAAEFKTVDPRTNKGKLPKEEHVRQVQIGAAMMRESDQVDVEIKGCVLIYMDASNYNDILEFKVPLKPTILDQLKGRANRVLDSKAANRLPREGKDNGGQECRQRCPFNKVCGVEGAGSSTAQGEKGGADLSVQVGKYVNAKEAMAYAKQEQDMAAERIKAVMQREGLSRVEVDGHEVSLSTVQGSLSYAAAVKELLGDIDLERYRGKPSERLTVK